MAGRISVRNRRTSEFDIDLAFENRLEKAGQTLKTGSKLSQQLINLLRFMLVFVFVSSLTVALPTVPQKAGAQGKALGEKFRRCVAKPLYRESP